MGAGWALNGANDEFQARSGQGPFQPHGPWQGHAATLQRAGRGEGFERVPARGTTLKRINNISQNARHDYYVAGHNKGENPLAHAFHCIMRHLDHPWLHT